MIIYKLIPRSFLWIICILLIHASVSDISKDSASEKTNLHCSDRTTRYDAITFQQELNHLFRSKYTVLNDFSNHPGWKFLDHQIIENIDNEFDARILSYTPPTLLFKDEIGRYIHFIYDMFIKENRIVIITSRFLSIDLQDVKIIIPELNEILEPYSIICKHSISIQRHPNEIMIGFYQSDTLTSYFQTHPFSPLNITLQLFHIRQDYRLQHSLPPLSSNVMEPHYRDSLPDSNILHIPTKDIQIISTVMVAKDNHFQELMNFIRYHYSLGIYIYYIYYFFPISSDHIQQLNEILLQVDQQQFPSLLKENNHHPFHLPKLQFTVIQWYPYYLSTLKHGHIISQIPMIQSSLYRLKSKISQNLWITTIYPNEFILLDTSKYLNLPDAIRNITTRTTTTTAAAAAAGSSRNRSSSFISTQDHSPTEHDHHRHHHPNELPDHLIASLSFPNAYCYFPTVHDRFEQNTTLSPGLPYEDFLNQSIVMDRNYSASPTRRRFFANSFHSLLIGFHDLEAIQSTARYARVNIDLFSLHFMKRSRQKVPSMVVEPFPMNLSRYMTMASLSQETVVVGQKTSMLKNQTNRDVSLLPAEVTEETELPVETEDIKEEVSPFPSEISFQEADGFPHVYPPVEL